MMAFQTEGWATWEIFRNTGKPAQPPESRTLWTTAGTYCKGLPGAEDLLHLMFPAGAGSLTIT